MLNAFRDLIAEMNTLSETLNRISSTDDIPPEINYISGILNEKIQELTRLSNA